MTVLGTVGIADKGQYNASATYVIGNFIYYQGSTWLALKNNLTGITPEEGENWKYLARGFGSDNLGQIEGTDTSGVLGTVGAEVASQALIDAIADRVMTKLIPYTNIANNFLATDPKTVLSGPMGKSLKDQLDTTNSNLALKASLSDLNITNTNFVKYNMEYHARIYLTSGYISGMINDKISQGYKGGDIALSLYAPPDTYNGNQYGIIKWTLVFSDIANLQFLVPRSSAIITRAISASESYDTGWVAH